jgi:F0F1-type ATP synthase assembly protein I
MGQPTEEPESERAGVSSGNGMVMGAAVGIVFAPLLGPFGMIIGAAIGLVAGAAMSRGRSNAQT